jgi:hypothetical protein
LVNIHDNGTLLSFSFELGYAIAMNKDNNKNNNSSGKKNYFSHPYCDHCKNKVSEIYQDSGDYCLECWQELTCPEV